MFCNLEELINLNSKYGVFRRLKRVSSFIYVISSLYDHNYIYKKMEKIEITITEEKTFHP